MRGYLTTAAAALALSMTVSTAGVAYAGPAVNQFEVKDLESAPGDFEFQSQNAWSSGQPRRKSALGDGGEVILDDNTVIKQRQALEVQLGITDWFRVRLGVEFEQERLEDPALFSQIDKFDSWKFDEVAVEGVLVFLKPRDNGIGLGLLIEYGAPVGAGDEAAELYIGPIVEARSGPWSMIANLMLVEYIGGKSSEDDFVRDEKLDFSYATQLQYRASKNWAFALEAYGTFDRLGNSGSPGEEREVFGDHDQHRMGPIAYYNFFPGAASMTLAVEQAKLSGAEGDDDKELSVSIGSGVLFGLNENTPDFTYKLSLEVEY